MRKCDICEESLPDDYVYDVCRHCCDMLLKLMKEPIVAVLDEDGYHSVN